MTMATIVFDPAAWLRDFTAQGGGYALTADRKLVFTVDHCDGHRLAFALGQIVGKPDRQAALIHAIEQRQNGESVQ